MFKNDEDLARKCMIEVWCLPDHVPAHEAEVTYWDDADTDECLGINPTVKWFRYKAGVVRTEVEVTDEESRRFFAESGLAEHYFPYEAEEASK